jgi:hypothetical protein
MTIFQLHFSLTLLQIITICQQLKLSSTLKLDPAYFIFSSSHRNDAASATQSTHERNGQPVATPFKSLHTVEPLRVLKRCITVAIDLRAETLSGIAKPITNPAPVSAPQVPSIVARPLPYACAHLLIVS